MTMAAVGAQSRASDDVGSWPKAEVPNCQTGGEADIKNKSRHFRF
jgi:hypothetical protein